jgi:hypothetical protein
MVNWKKLFDQRDPYETAFGQNNQTELSWAGFLHSLCWNAVCDADQPV